MENKGMRFKRIRENGETVIYSTSYHYDDNKIEFGETDENKGQATYYTIETIGEGKQRLTLDYYESKKIAARLLFDLFRKKKISASFKKSLDNLDTLVKDIRLPGEQ